MKSQNLVLSILILMGISCENDETNLSNLKKIKSKDGINYNQSINNWTELKNVNGNSYMYQTTFTSWTGYGSTTELKIENGKITSRIYEEFQMDENFTKEIIDSYTENADDLGTHEKGALLKTIDDLYASCAKDYIIVDQDHNKIYFETSEGGMMTLCGFVPDGCMDDCFRGIRINAFGWL